MTVMKHIRVAFAAALLLFTVQVASAQPTQRRVQATQQTSQRNQSDDSGLSLRARTQYPVQTNTYSQVNWKRDIYRELDLTKERNAALYYPEEPLGDRVNFFTLVLRLILDGKVSAYEYRLDGNELFTEDNKLDIETMLDKFYIYYEKKDGKYVVLPADIPSTQIVKYFIKESNYVDQRTTDYRTRVTAICPVLVEEGINNPMFWLNYEEISPYLAQTQLMTSSFNNTSNMSVDDYFVMHQYEGDIYKTSNLRNLSLLDQVGGDSASVKDERARIEQQLSDFQNHLWNSSSSQSSGVSEADADTDASASDKTKSSAKEDRAAAKAQARQERAAKNAQTKTRTEKAPKTERSSGGTISVHGR